MVHVVEFVCVIVLITAFVTVKSLEVNVVQSMDSSPETRNEIADVLDVAETAESVRFGGVVSTGAGIVT
jgi:hypothetical protein